MYGCMAKIQSPHPVINCAATVANHGVPCGAAGCCVLDSHHGTDLRSGECSHKTRSTTAQIVGVVATKVKVVET